jgi:hypothetical protein
MHEVRTIVEHMSDVCHQVALKTQPSVPPPCPSLASQSLPITLTPPIATVTIKTTKRADEATKIHMRQCRTRPLSISHKSAHLNCRSRHHRSQQHRQHCKGPHCNNLLSPRCQRIRKQPNKPISPSLQLALPTDKTKAPPLDVDLHCSVSWFILYCGASKLKQRRAYVWLRKRKKKMAKKTRDRGS